MIARNILERQFMNDPTGRRKLIQNIDKKFKIVELFVNDIEVYL